MDTEELDGHPTDTKLQETDRVRRDTRQREDRDIGLVPLRLRATIRLSPALRYLMLHLRWHLLCALAIQLGKVSPRHRRFKYTTNRIDRHVKDTSLTDATPRLKIPPALQLFVLLPMDP